MTTTKITRTLSVDGGTQTTEEEALSSVTLTVNAKGFVQPEIKVYHADPMAAYEKAKAILERARQDGFGGGNS